MTKKDLVKINDYLWEIPQSFRRDMRVPARIYADCRLLEKLFEDKTLEQLVNVAGVPGIIKWALAMPDAHEGYGMPIGGVAATDIKENGIISPGMIGYDINCLSPEAKILLENGSYATIKEIEKIWRDKKVSYVDLRKKTLADSSMVYFLKRYNNPSIYQITTLSGEKIKATGEHPIQTKQGMKEAKDLGKDESILIYPFKGVKFKNPPQKILLDKNDFIRTLIKVRKKDSGNAFVQVVKQMDSRKIFPLRHNSELLPIILKLMGYIIGDGAISFINKKNGIIWFYGEKNDLEDIRKDIIKIGFKPSRVYSRRRNCSITTFYRTYNFSRTEYSIKIGSTSLAMLFVALGMPYGLKAHQKYRVPRWIFNCPLWQKRLFLASFFGAELSNPSTFNKYNFYAPQLNMNKSKELKRSAGLFLKDIADLLKEFEVETSPIKEVPGNQYKGKQGETAGFRLMIKENSENLINFFEKVNYEYNQKKHREACLAANYLKRKLKVVNLRTIIREKFRKTYRQKGNYRKLAEKYVGKYIPVQFLHHSLFKENRWGIKKERGNPRISFDFPSFKEYKKLYAYGKRGLVWEETEKIKKIPYAGFVYDFTINSSSHNFIANNFVVSNCGVRILASDLDYQEIKPHLVNLMNQIQRDVPSGLGQGGGIKLNPESVNNVLKKGVKWAAENDYGEKEDIEHCEEQGAMESAESSAVSNLAKQRGRNQLGTLGSGNHFLEVQRVEEIFNEKTAKSFGLEKDKTTIMIHSGSRGLGHQVCTDYIRLMRQALDKYRIKLTDPELAGVHFESAEGKRYFGAMSAAANFAWANRQMITHLIRGAWRKALGEKAGKLRLIYDVAHNIAKIEEHQGRKVCVHRKGATRTFPAGVEQLPDDYQKVGQPVLIPGTMGTASYILVGSEQAKETFFSVCHGAGRVLSRHAAIRQIQGSELRRQLEKEGIIVRCLSNKGLAEEAPLAYKDIHNVVDAVVKAGLAKLVARLRPMGVVKG